MEAKEKACEGAGGNEYWRVPGRRVGHLRPGRKFGHVRGVISHAASYVPLAPLYNVVSQSLLPWVTSSYIVVLYDLLAINYYNARNESFHKDPK